MKIRNGWVSNSSSSSFIIGVGKVANYEKLLSEIEKNINNKNLISFIKVKDIKKSSYEIQRRNGYISIESFIYSEASISDKDLKEDDVIAYFDQTGVFDDDSDFMDEDGDIDYDIPLEFTEDQKMACKLFNDKTLIEKCDIITGAGRNG